MNRKQLLGRLMSYYMSMSVSHSNFGFYYPWVQRPIGAYVRIQFGYTYEDMWGTHFNSTDNYYTSDSRFIPDSSSVSVGHTVPPIFGVFDISKTSECTKENMIYTNACISSKTNKISIRFDYGYLYNYAATGYRGSMIVCKPGRYKIKVLSSGAGYNFSSVPREKVFEVHDYRGDPAIYNSYWGYNIQTIQVEMESRFDFCGYVGRCEREVFDVADLYELFYEFPIGGVSATPDQLGFVSPKKSLAGAKGLKYNVFVDYKSVTDGLPLAADLAASSDSFGSLKIHFNRSDSFCGTAYPWYFEGGVARAYNLRGVDSFYRLYVPEINYTFTPALDDYMNGSTYYKGGYMDYCWYLDEANFNVELTTYAAMGYNVPYGFVLQRSEGKKGATPNKWMHPVYTHETFIWYDIGYNDKYNAYERGVTCEQVTNEAMQSDGVKELMERSSAWRKEIDEARTATYEPVLEISEGATYQNYKNNEWVNRRAPDGSQFYWTYKDGSNGTICTAAELRRDYATATVTYWKLVGLKPSYNPSEGKYYDDIYTVVTDDLYYDKHATVGLTAEGVYEEIQEPKFEGEVNWDGIEYHDVDRFWKNNMIFRTSVIDYEDLESFLPVIR